MILYIEYKTYLCYIICLGSGFYACNKWNKIKTQDCICFVFCSIPLRFSFLTSLSLNYQVHSRNVLYCYNACIGDGLTQLICMFDLYASLHSPF